MKDWKLEFRKVFNTMDLTKMEGFIASQIEKAEARKDREWTIKCEKAVKENVSRAEVRGAKRVLEKAFDKIEKEIGILSTNMMWNDSDHEYIDTCLIYKAIWNVRNKFLTKERVRKGKV